MTRRSTARTKRAAASAREVVPGAIGVAHTPDPTFVCCLNDPGMSILTAQIPDFPNGRHTGGV